MAKLKSAPELWQLYEKATRWMRWLVIIFVGLTFWLQPKNHLWIALLLGLVIVQNSLYYTRWFQETKITQSKWYAVLVNLSLVLALIVLTGGLNSPYRALLFLTVATIGYWYGFGGLAIALVILLGSLIYIIYVSGQALLSDINKVNFIVILMITGYYLAKINHLDQLERDQIISSDALLRREQARLITLVNSLAEAIFVVNPQGEIVLYNAAALDLIDTHQEITGQPLTKALPLTDSQGRPFNPVDEILTKSTITLTREDLIFKTGDRSLNLFVNASVIDQNGVKTGALVLARDISKQKTLDNQKDEFISIISHELRSPVAVVEADLSTALMPKVATLPSKTRKLITNASQNLQYLSNLINDLSSLSAAEKSLLNIELSYVEPAELVGQLVENFKKRAEAKGLSFQVEITASLPAVHTSRQRVEETLVNYLTNAIKYSGNSKVVKIIARPSIKIKDGVQFSVVDQGLGISEKDQKQLFKKYYRSSNERALKIKGTGMGLYITKKQAEKIGGQVWVESKLGVGSAFYLEIPRQIRTTETFSFSS